MSRKTNKILAWVFMGLTIVTAIALVATLASAATLQWDRNAEADMKEYEVYTCTPNPTCTVQQVATSRVGIVPQVAVGVIPSFVIPAGTEGKVAVSASDLTGNESGLSVSIPFDAKGPGAPLNPRLAP